MRDVSTAEAHKDVWGLMFCWIRCSTGGREVGEDRRENSSFWGKEMEIYRESDRCKIQGGRRKER